MTATAGIRWGFAPAVLVRAVGAAAAALLVATAAGSSVPAVASGGERVAVVVRGVPGAAVEAIADSVRSLGGTAKLSLPIINGLSAEVPAEAMDELRSAPGVGTVTPDVELKPLHHTNNNGPGGELGKPYELARMIGADEMWAAGFTGKGVDVALMDTGVLPVEGLKGPGKVVNGIDLSFESQEGGGDPGTFQHLDTNGHGTAMASVIAARDSSITNPATNGGVGYQGIAPDARLINVKVAGYDGAVDVSQVIAAIDWIVQHRRSNGMNIRVLNLSYGTDSSQDWVTDPLSYAAEAAWKNGIVVVAAAGNDGKNTQLAMPAANPYVIAVGASDHRDTSGTADDTMASFSTYLNGTRRPDVVAPGLGVWSLRAPESQLDSLYPEARMDARQFRGSGTSQAAAAVSGAAALLLQQRPDMNPDQVKALLKNSATKLTGTTTQAQGSGMVDLRKARVASTPGLAPSSQSSLGNGTGTGSLHQARGTMRLYSNGVELTGEKDIFGKPFVSATWAPLALLGSSWRGGDWNGSTWSGSDWSGSSWSGSSWRGSSWRTTDWSGSSWRGSSWRDHTWTGSSWRDDGFTGSSWRTSDWLGSSWRTGEWTGSSWRGSWSSAGWQ